MKISPTQVARCGTPGGRWQVGGHADHPGHGGGGCKQHFYHDTAPTITFIILMTMTRDRIVINIIIVRV